jgi:predicted RND superfamily exporter protein
MDRNRTPDRLADPLQGPRLAERLTGQVYDHPWPCLAAMLLLTVLASWQASTLGMDNAVDIWFLEDDPTLVAWQDFQQEWENDEVVAIAFHDEAGLLNERGYALLRQVEARLEAVDGVAEATSLVSTLSVRSDEGWLEVAQLVPEEPDDEEALREQILGDPLLVGKLVSEDGQTLMVLARMEAMEDLDARRDAVIAELQQSLRGLDPEPHYAGVGVVYSALNRLSAEDSGIFMAGSCVVIALLLTLMYRRVGSMLVTMAVVGVGAVWLMGGMGLAGRDINMVTMVLPTLVLIIGISDAAHLLQHAARDVRAGESRRDRVVRTVGFLFWPCLYNTLTSALGFLALMTAPMAVVRDLGLFAAVGLLCAFFAAWVGITVALRWSWVEPRQTEGAWLDRLVEGAAEIGVSHPRKVVGVSVLVALLSVAGMTRLEVDTYSIDFLFPDHPVRQDSDAIEAWLGPYTPLEVVLEAPGRALEPELLQAVRTWEDRVVAEVDTIGWSRSLTGLLGRLHEVLAGEPGLPESSEAAAQALLLYESDRGNDLHTMLRGEDQLRVTFGMDMQSAAGMAATVEQLEALAEAELPAHVVVRPSGYIPLYTVMMDYIVRSQVNSFGTAFLVVFVVFSLMFRSLRAGALAIPSNVLPVLVLLGVMGAVGLRLDVATVTIASIVLGLVVDDTVQFIYRLRAELRAGRDHEEAVRATVHGLGRSLVIASLGLALGFAVLGLAQVKSLVYFGLLTSATLLVAQAMELLVMPAVVVLTRPKL